MGGRSVLHHLLFLPSLPPSAPPPPHPPPQCCGFTGCRLELNEALCYDPELLAATTSAVAIETAGQLMADKQQDPSWT